jgi:peptidoglycan hydrolase-like protein with peptidoglycan-binding domain
MLVADLQAAGPGTVPSYPIGGYQPPIGPSQPTTGPDLVIAIEQELQALGYEIEPSGGSELRRKTRESLRRFQKDAGLTVTTEATPVVLQQLRAGRPSPGSKLGHLYLAIEQHLAQKGYPVGIVDGTIDEQGRAAIRAFQRDVGQSQTGVPSESLLNHLASSTIRPTVTTATILDIERELSRRRYSVGPVDGVVDLRTQFGIESYQRHAGLPVTGEATTALLAHMRANPQISAYGYQPQTLTGGSFDSF